MLRIIIPSAGKGSRFSEAGFKLPKPFIDLHGKTMLQRVIDNLTPCEPHRFTLIFQREHEELVKEYKLNAAADIVYVDKVTDGAARTVLLARDLIRPQDSLLIANSDQLVDFNSAKEINHLGFGTVEPRAIFWRNNNNIQDLINDCRINLYDGSIAVFPSDKNPKWSYALTDEYGDVKEVAEKKVISEWATVGLYYFERSSYFTSAADQMIKKNIRTNGEFYVAPSINESIEMGNRFGIYEVKKMYGLGTPEDFKVSSNLLKFNEL